MRAAFDRRGAGLQKKRRALIPEAQGAYFGSAGRF